MNKNKKVKCDSGYLGVEKIHSNSELPKKSSKLRPLTKKDKKENKKFSRMRVRVEHVIGRIKVFRIMAERYRNRRKYHNIRMELICGIINFERK